MEKDFDHEDGDLPAWRLHADPTIRRGIYLSMCVDWCARVLAGIGVNSTTYSAPPPSVGERLSYVNFTGTDAAWIDRLARRAGLLVLPWPDDRMAGGGREAAAAALDTLHGGGPAFLLTFAGDDETPAIALFRDAAALRLFDPAIGQYSAPWEGPIGARVSARLEELGAKLDPGGWQIHLLVSPVRAPYT